MDAGDEQRGRLRDEVRVRAVRRAMKKNAAVVQIRHHFSSMGRSDVYELPDGGSYGGLSLGALGFETGEGDRFLVTVERLPRIATGPRFRANPWKWKRRKRRKKAVSATSRQAP